MAEIDSLGTNYYYAGVHGTANEAIKKNQKNEQISSAKKTKFSDLLKTTEEEPQFSTNGLPPEIASMSIDDAAIYLKDAVDNAGNDLSEELNAENIQKFKTAVSQFMKFVINNNFEVSSKSKRRSAKAFHSRSPFFFSTYSVPPKRSNPRYQVQVINEKLDALTRATLEGQMDNLKILAQVNEIKGLIVDLMSS